MSTLASLTRADSLPIGLFSPEDYENLMDDSEHLRENHLRPLLLSRSPDELTRQFHDAKYELQGLLIKFGGKLWSSVQLREEPLRYFAELQEEAYATLREGAKAWPKPIRQAFDTGLRRVREFELILVESLLKRSSRTLSIWAQFDLNDVWHQILGSAVCLAAIRYGIDDFADHERALVNIRTLSQWVLSFTHELEDYGETISIQSNQRLMESIRKGMSDIDEGRTHPLSELLAENGN